jgi:DNA polymerase III subunit epsilon
VLIENGKVLTSFQELCNPGVKIPTFITKFTGISNEMLVGKPTTEVVMSRLHIFIGNRPIIAHNAAFDSRFLMAEMKRIQKNIANIFLCTLLLSRRLLQGLCSYKLSYLKIHLNYKAAATHCDHRALDDVLVTVHLWNHLHKVLIHHGVKVTSPELLLTISKLSKKEVPEFLQKEGQEIISKSTSRAPPSSPKFNSPTNKRKREEEDYKIEEDKNNSTPPNAVIKIVLRRSPRSIQRNNSHYKKNHRVVDLTNTPGPVTRNQGLSHSKKRPKRQRQQTLMDIFKKGSGKKA